jgi:uncharacterized protein (DUF2147 family)
MTIKVVPLAALALALARPAMAADVEGVWLSPSRGAHIKIEQCGDALCGKLVSASRPKTNPQYLDIHNRDSSLRSRSVIGITLLDGFTGGPTRWTGGHVYNPGDGNTYQGTLTLIDGDHLELKGCTLWVLCKSQVWTRVD